MRRFPADLRTGQSTNQLVVSLLEDHLIETRRQREAAVAAIYRAVGVGGGHARLALDDGSRGRGAAGHDRDLASRLLSL